MLNNKNALSEREIKNHTTSHRMLENGYMQLKMPLFTNCNVTINKRINIRINLHVSKKKKQPTLHRISDLI